MVLTIGWNVLSHVELEPAHCGDENCEADHGYTGTITADDLTLRVSEAADGEDAVRQVLAFAQALSEATAAPDATTAEAGRDDAAEPGAQPDAAVATARAAWPTCRSILAVAGRGRRGRTCSACRRPDRVCLLVVDGLGWELLRGHPAAAPFLSELAVNGRPLTAGFPATTATSLASLGTGLPPGAARRARLPGRGARRGGLLNALRWDKRIDPVRLAAGADDLRARRGGRDRRLRVAPARFQQTAA